MNLDYWTIGKRRIGDHPARKLPVCLSFLSMLDYWTISAETIPRAHGRAL
jgi:hypothetical protein